MSSFALTCRALADLREIASFTHAAWGLDQRNIYIKQFDDLFHLLADTPTIGKSCDEIRNGYRKFPQGSHVIFYKSGDNTTIEIVRILHKRMDVETQFHDGLR